MKYIIAVLLVAFSFHINAGVGSYDQITGLFYFSPMTKKPYLSNTDSDLYVIAKTNGFIYFRINGLINNACVSNLAAGENILERPFEIIAQAPSWLSWSINCDSFIGGGNGEIEYINERLYSLVTISSNYVIDVFATRDNLIPVIHNTTNYLGIEYDVYTVTPVIGAPYRNIAAPPLTFQCIINSSSEYAKVLKRLKFDDPKIGVMYSLNSNKNATINGIGSCIYGQIKIATTYLEVQ